MTPERWQRIENLSPQGLEIDPGARNRFLVENCAGDIAVRDTVANLLKNNESSGDVLEKPAWLNAKAMLLEVKRDLQEEAGFAGDRIDACRMLADKLAPGA